MSRPRSGLEQRGLALQGVGETGYTKAIDTRGTILGLGTIKGALEMLGGSSDPGPYTLGSTS